MHSGDSRKINVIQLTQFLGIGGLESFIVDLCKAMDRGIFNVGVLCLNKYDEHYRDSLQQYGIPVDLIRKNGKYDWRFLLRAADFLKSRNTDVVHVHGGCLLYGALIGRLSGAKEVIYTIHGMPIFSGLQASLEEFVSLALIDNIVAVSSEVADYYRKRNRFLNGKLQTIINGIDHTRYTPCNDQGPIARWKALYGLPPDKKIIGSVGRLEPVKNYQVMLRAFSELVHHWGNDAHLVLVGDGSEETDLRVLADRLSIANRVSFLGMQYNMPTIYPVFDVFALSSTTEGTSISLLEAQSCGIPAVVTDVGGNSAIIRDGYNGYLCPSGDYLSIADRLHRLLKNESETMKMKKAARENVLIGFTMACVAQRYQHLYRSLLREN